jgi:hypothetical protein
MLKHNKHPDAATVVLHLILETAKCFRSSSIGSLMR